MHLCHLRLHNFRQYKEASFTFSPKVNVIRGPNARGKTTILEAIYVLITGRSFRTPQLLDLINEEASYFILEAVFVKHGIEQSLKFYYNGKERKITHNTTPYFSTTILFGLLQGTVVHPDDATIIKGPPAIRRHLMDVSLAQVDPLYIHHLTRYMKAMHQRNALLKLRQLATIEPWETEMASSAAYVVHHRNQIVRDLQEKGRPLHERICGSAEELSLTYKANGAGNGTDCIGDLREIFFDQYQRHRSREMEFGCTLTGPHKDDLLIACNKREAKSFASDGQQRSSIVALRLAEWERLHQLSGNQPFMLVDDMNMSLDDSRKLHLLEYLHALSQVFVTTTKDKAFFNHEFVIEI